MQLRVCAGFPLLLVVVACGAGAGSGGTGVRQRPAALQIVSGNAQLGTVGKELPEAVVVRVVDSTGAPVEGQLVNFRVVAGGGTTFAGSALTNSSGIARERWTLGTNAAAVQRL